MKYDTSSNILLFDFETEILTCDPTLMNNEKMPRSEISQLEKD